MKIIINTINDVVAGRFSTMEQKRDLHRNSVLKPDTKHEFPHVTPKEPIEMLDVFYA